MSEDRAGQLWEHGSLRYLVLERVKSERNELGWSWRALAVHDEPDPTFDGQLIVHLAEEFFDQEWWRRVA